VKLVHLVGFIIKKVVTIHGHVKVKKKKTRNFQISESSRIFDNMLANVTPEEEQMRIIETILNKIHNNYLNIRVKIY